ncbi:tetratricopeptide repeat protein [Oculatella sp. LEGE 06141]|nr:tetratricopeptide repeat protein [Oculatella sp. LEGE 06141]
MHLFQHCKILQHCKIAHVGGTVLAIALLISPILAPIAGAEEDPDTFPPNPLEITSEDDPLLPRLLVDRPLSPQERRVLATALDELNRQAEARLRAADPAGAFEIWNRELRLRRVLGVQEEVTTLSRVGEVAWRENQTTEVRIITQRLQEIEQELQAQQPLNYDLLLTIAQSYQQLRARDPAVTLYEQILVQARQQQEGDREQQILTALGELHLAWFDYARAGETYQQLLASAQARQNRANEIEALKQLASIYQEGNQPEQAIAIQQQLVTLYEQQQDYLQIPPLKLAMGDAYTELQRLNGAASSYQEAFAVARSVQQYGYASDALQRLATLYRSIDRLDDALTVYQLLLDVEQQSYNTLGTMNAYDQMGQIYRDRGQQPQALAAFQRGLELAQQLNYKISYFTTQIDQLNQPAESSTEPQPPDLPPVEPPLSEPQPQ